MLVALLALLMATLPTAVSASPAVAEIEVTYDYESEAWVITSSKGLSNIVVSDGEEHVRTEFDNSEETYVWSVDDPDAATIWVKSGSHRSGDGPGYGERFDLAAPDCDTDGEDGDGEGGELPISFT